MVGMIECGPQRCGSGLNYFLTDHLGSVVAVVNPGGGLVSQQRYMPFGEVRTDVGTITQTDFGYTGQRNLDAQGNSFSTGLMDYKARFYDPYINRFISPDTITPGGPQGLNRYSYSNNNPINFNDPSGHMADECGDFGCEADIPTIPTDPTNPGTNATRSKTTYPNPCEIDPGLPMCRSTPTYGPGYKGPLPDDLKQILELHGANKALIDSVTLRIGSGTFGCRANYAAVTFFSDINYCTPNNFNPYYPDQFLVHELVHVRQNRDFGPIPLIENQPVKLYEWVNHLFGGRYDPYVSFWVEVEAAHCQSAYVLNPGIPLNQSPCNLK
jgi:RHS repeat-associated protein